MMLDSSHHHGDFLSPPGGHSPNLGAPGRARGTSETLERAADAVSHEATENPVVNGAQQGELRYEVCRPVCTCQAECHTDIALTSSKSTSRDSELVTSWHHLKRFTQGER